jgi:hypothetical protein
VHPLGVKAFSYRSVSGSLVPRKPVAGAPSFLSVPHNGSPARRNLPEGGPSFDEYFLAMIDYNRAEVASLQAAAN